MWSNLVRHSKFLDERDDITEYVRGLKAGTGLDESAIRAGYQQFKDAKAARELSGLSAKHGLPNTALQGFVETIVARKIFDGEQLTELLGPFDLGWKARTHSTSSWRVVARSGLRPRQSRVPMLSAKCCVFCVRWQPWFCKC